MGKIVNRTTLLELNLFNRMHFHFLSDRDPFIVLTGARLLTSSNAHLLHCLAK